MDGRPVLEDERIDAIFDTGITWIVGDSNRIGQFYAALEPFGAQQGPSGLYTSTYSSGSVDWLLHNV